MGSTYHTKAFFEQGSKVDIHFLHHEKHKRGCKLVMHVGI